jgi:hypothetical protein
MDKTNSVFVDSLVRIASDKSVLDATMARVRFLERVLFDLCFFVGYQAGCDDLNAAPVAPLSDSELDILTNAGPLKSNG